MLGEAVQLQDALLSLRQTPTEHSGDWMVSSNESACEVVSTHKSDSASAYQRSKLAVSCIVNQHIQACSTLMLVQMHTQDTLRV